MLHMLLSFSLSLSLSSENRSLPHQLYNLHSASLRITRNFQSEISTWYHWYDTIRVASASECLLGSNLSTRPPVPKRGSEETKLEIGTTESGSIAADVFQRFSGCLSRCAPSDRLVMIYESAVCQESTSTRWLLPTCRQGRNDQAPPVYPEQSAGFGYRDQNP